MIYQFCIKQALIMMTDWNPLGADHPPILTCPTFPQILDNNNTVSSRPYLPGEPGAERRGWCPPTWASMVWGRSIKTMVMEVLRWARGKCQVGFFALLLRGGTNFFTVNSPPFWNAIILYSKLHLLFFCNISLFLYVHHYLNSLVLT